MASPSAFPWKDSKNSVAEVDMLHHFHPSSPEHDDNNTDHDAVEKDDHADKQLHSSSNPLTSTRPLDHDCWMQKEYTLLSGDTQQQTLLSGTSYCNIGPGFSYWDATDRPEKAGWSIPFEERLKKEKYRVQVQHRVAIGEKDRQRWAEIAKLLPDVSHSNEPLRASQPTKLRDILGIVNNHDLFAQRAKNLDLTSSQTLSGAMNSLGATLRTEHSNLTQGLLLFLLPAIYGAVHLSAWSFEFPSPVEKLLWKIACLDLVISLPVFLVVGVARENRMVGVGGRDNGCVAELTLLSWGGLLFLLLNVPVTVVARMYLVVESFISLRHVPIGVYATVPWSDWLPHI
jgi:hypothetical protein